MARINVQPLDVMAEAIWTFEQSKPTYRHHSYGYVSVFDPYPAYPHLMADVQAAVRVVEAACPPIWDVDLVVADREEEGRSNGHSNIYEHGHHDDDGQWVKDPPVGFIMLSGKRIPPHPAMTRHLVAHEVGHNVEWMLEHLRGTEKRAIHSGIVVNDYARLRGLPVPTHHGTGGRWHNSATEVFACDFRLLVAKVEPEYWPHPGVPRPEELPGLADWWAEALNDLAEKRAQQ